MWSFGNWPFLHFVFFYKTRLSRATYWASQSTGMERGFQLGLQLLFILLHSPSWQISLRDLSKQFSLSASPPPGLSAAYSVSVPEGHSFLQQCCALMEGPRLLQVAHQGAMSLANPPAKCCWEFSSLHTQPSVVTSAPTSTSPTQSPYSEDNVEQQPDPWLTSVWQVGKGEKGKSVLTPSLLPYKSQHPPTQSNLSPMSRPNPSGRMLRGTEG